MEATGYVLHETKRRVVIATLHSENAKTGDMAQVWILARNSKPADAARSGEDRVVCGNCPHRLVNGATCYVILYQGPRGVWEAYQRGRYPKLAARDYEKVFAGRKVRFGAYGDPAFVPRKVIEKLAAAASGFTGYTHQWRRNPELSQWLMASVDSIEEQAEAKAKGWRTFRVSKTGNDRLKSEIACPYYTRGIQCVECGLCAGNSVKAKDIVVKVHGSGAKRFAA